MDPDDSLQSADGSSNAAESPRGSDWVLQPEQVPPPIDVLSSEAPLGSSSHRSLARPPRRRKRLLAALAALVVVIGGGVAAAVALLPSGGAQPEDILPANTLAFMKLDLAPGLGQEIDAYRFLSNFPNTFKNLDSQDPLGSVLNSTPRGNGIDWQQVKPWIGNRSAVAWVPTSGGPQVVALVAITDEAKMRSYFSAHSPDTKVAVSHGFAIISNNQSAIDSVKSATSHLSGLANYRSDRAALGGEQILVAWADLKPIYGNLQTLLSRMNPLLSNPFGANLFDKAASTIGRMITGLHFTSNTVVLKVMSRGGAPSATQTFSGVADDLSALPKDVLAAISTAPFSQGVFDSLTQAPQLGDILQQAGIDVAALRGAFAGGVTVVVLPSASDPSAATFAVRLRPTDVSATESIIEGLAGGAVSAVSVQNSGPYLYLGQGQDDLQYSIRQLAASGPSLGSQAGYQSVVPGRGVFMGYANVGRLIDMAPGAPADARKLGSFGLLVKLDPANPSDSTATFTLTIK